MILLKYNSRLRKFGHISMSEPDTNEWHTLICCKNEIESHAYEHYLTAENIENSNGLVLYPRVRVMKKQVENLQKTILFLQNRNFFKE